MNIENLPGLGPKSAAWLHRVDIFSKEDLQRLGPITAIIRLERAGIKPGLNMLYALVGALEGVHWQQVARAQKGELVLALDAARELEKLSEG